MQAHQLIHFEPIVAVSSPPGTGAVALIRVSGKGAIEIVDTFFEGKINSKPLSQRPGQSVHFGKFKDENHIWDEVLITLFKAPHSYTGDDLVEISCHGSSFIQQKILNCLLSKGARMAGPGEFTLRAFLNRKLDLTQAEAVADLIAADSEASHQLALSQMRGGFGQKLQQYRQDLIDFAALLELELDFSEEDVEFADRSRLQSLLNGMIERFTTLADSFQQGNVIKTGVPVAIVGPPNAGKSTLLNALLNEEKAIVSDIPGTTRDYIEDKLVINGVAFRIIDTAGLRETNDVIEEQGVQRSRQKMKEASLVLYVFDVQNQDPRTLDEVITELHTNGKPWLLVANKSENEINRIFTKYDKNIIFISALTGKGLSDLTIQMFNLTIGQNWQSGGEIVSNVRYRDGLLRAVKSLSEVLIAMNQKVSGELLAMDLRTAIMALGEITGQVDNEEILGSIFSRFCIGK